MSDYSQLGAASAGCAGGIAEKLGNASGVAEGGERPLTPDPERPADGARARADSWRWGQVKRNNERARGPSACLVEVGEQGGQGGLRRDAQINRSRINLPPPCKKQSLAKLKPGGRKAARSVRDGNPCTDDGNPYNTTRRQAW